MRNLVVLLVVLLVSCKNQPQPSQTTSDKLAADSESDSVHKASGVIIDGVANEAAWAEVEWQAIDQVWIGEALSDDDFKGQYKLLWDENHLYVLAEIHDDTLMDIHADPIDHYWDDDCLEVFIDEDASRGDHQYNHNAFAYHIALDNKVADIGTNKEPQLYDHVDCKRKMTGKKALWELAITIYNDTYIDSGDNQKVTLSSDKKLGFAIAYCDNDYSDEREHFIGSEVVEGEDKNRGWIDAGVFGEIVLK